MKLDSIVYDYNTLTSAIATTLNSESTTFQAIYPSDTATSLCKVLGAYGSMLQYQLVSAMANCYTETAYSEAGIRQLAETLGNRLHGNISSQLYCDITRTSLIGLPNVVIPAGSVFAVEDLLFFNPEPILFGLQQITISNVKLVQGELLTVEKYAAGISGEKIYFCDEFKCNTNMVRVFVNNEEWKITDSFLPYVVADTSVQAESQVVVLRTDSDGRTYIKFGNNSNGIIPQAGSTIKIQYVSNEGANGNLNHTNIDIALNTPLFYMNGSTREQLTVEIYSVTTATGGFNTQSLDVLRQSSPYVFASGQRAVRRSDYKSILLNQCGYLTCNVWGEYEETKLYGGYDKIMMNMVYYTGIKSIQKYSYQPLKTLYISVPLLEESETGFYNFSNNLIGARGFLGSYIIDISSQNDQNEQETIKYRDRTGTGILTCDPTINNTIEDFETNIFPNNDILPSYENREFHISTNQKYDPESHSGAADPSANPELLLYGYAGAADSPEYQSSGMDAAEQPKVISFDNPFQIRFSFDNRKCIAAFAFQTPHTDLNLGKFINQFAIFATNETEPSYDNIKNNTNTWTRVSELQSFERVLSANEWSDWITTNVYQPGSSTTETEDLSNQVLENKQETLIDTGDHLRFTIQTLAGPGYYSYRVEVNGQTIPAEQYTISTDDPTDAYVLFNQAQPAGAEVILHANDRTVFEIYNLIGSDYVYKVQVNGDTLLTNAYTIEEERITFLEPQPVDATIILYGTTSTWISYQNYVIEVYSLRDANITLPRQICIQKIKALFKESVSTIDYNNNNYVNMNIPILESTSTTPVYTRLGTTPLDPDWLTDTPGGSPITPHYYELYLITDNITRTNVLAAPNDGGTGYAEGDILVIPDTEPTYVSEHVAGFRIQVNAVDNQGSITEASLLDEYTESTSITLDAIPVIPVAETGTGTGANLTILSTLNHKYTHKRAKWITENNKYLLVNTNIKKLGLPEDMQYYIYTVECMNIDETHGYRQGDLLQYVTNIDNYRYNFEIYVKNPATQEFTITLTIDNNLASEILRGKSSITLNEVDAEGGSGTGAKLNIKSESTLKVTGSYIGNFYSNNDIQATDLPVINKYNHFTTYIEFKQPRIKNIQLSVVIEYENVINYQTTKKNVVEAIHRLFDITPEYIGKSLDLSNIWKAINAVDGVKRFQVITPVTNINCMPYELIMLPDENLTIQDILNSEMEQDE